LAAKGYKGTWGVRADISGVKEISLQALSEGLQERRNRDRPLWLEIKVQDFESHNPEKTTKWLHLEGIKIFTTVFMFCTRVFQGQRKGGYGSV